MSWRRRCSVEIGVVVDRRDGDVDLRGPVRRIAPVGRRDALVTRHELPPDRVEIGLGIGVQRALELVHHQHPACEDEQLGGAGRREARPRARRPRRVDAEHPLQPLAHRPASAPNRIADALGDDEMRVAQQPGEDVPKPGRTRAWPSSWSIVSIHSLVGTTFASTRTSPARSTSMQNACWHLPSRGKRSLRVEHVRARTRSRRSSPRERDDVASSKQRVEVDGSLGRRLLEERIGVVPWPELRRAAEARREPLVERALPAGERLGGDTVGVGQRARSASVHRSRRRDSESANQSR